jgi:hypothetical protein
MNTLNNSFQLAQLSQAAYALGLVKDMSGQTDTAYLVQLKSKPNHCINSDCNKVMQRASIHPGNATTRISRRGWHSWSG